MAEWDFVLAPATVTVRFKLAPVLTLLNSLRLLSAVQYHSGLGDWVVETAHHLDHEQQRLNDFVTDAVSLLAHEGQAASFPEFIEEVRQSDPAQLREAIIYWMREQEAYPGDEALLSSRETFVDFVRRVTTPKLEKKGLPFDEARWDFVYEQLLHPERLRMTCANHLKFMWDTYLEEEWRHVRPTLQEAYDVFSRMDYSGLTAHEAIEAITGRNMRGSENLSKHLNKTETLTFIPSAHLGPYIGWDAREESRQVVFYFGARPPKDAPVTSTALSRSELLVRLNALADETRLQILELLTQETELCAQDFINRLDLSQSSASRHLRQLTASGYLSERRRDVAKCYSLNRERIDDTIQALKDFLRKP